MPKKKMQTPNQDIIIQALKEKYFNTLTKENYPHTPKITEEADNLEKAIRELLPPKQ